MPTNALIQQPSLSGTMPDAFPQYRDLANGFTDRIFLLGHGPNSMTLNDPYQVVDIREAVNKLEADASCPLLRGLMELYYGGARDIFLVSSAPMSEFQSDTSLRDHSWYSAWAARLATTYEILLDWDLPQIVVPLDAPYYDAKGVDFLSPLINHCARSFDQVGSVRNDPNTGNIRVGLIGTTTGPLTASMITAMATDSRLNSMSADGKFVSVIVGEGIVNIREMPTLYTASLVTSVAAELSQLPYNKSLTYTKLRNIMNLVTRPNKDQASQLTDARLNPVGLTSLGLRNQVFESVILTDNTLSPTGSDFWSLVQVRLSMHIIDMTRALGRRYLGTVGFGQFKQDLQTYFLSLIASNYVKDCSIQADRDTVDKNTVNVAISFTPYFGLRQISFKINVGPAN